jgi:hypothetical protein
MGTLARSHYFFFTLAVVTGGCSPDREVAFQEVVMDTVNGVIVVRNGEHGLWPESRGWVVEVDFRVGEASGAEAVFFTSLVTSVSIGPQGHIFVLDFQSQEITVLDGRGNLLRRFGGPGRGPGELNGPGGMGWDRLGRLWIAEGWNLRYTVFDSTGSLIKTVPRPIRGLTRLQYPLVFDGAGSFLDEGLGGPALLPILVDTAGSRIDTLAPLMRPPRPANVLIPPGSDRTPLLYLPSLVHAVSPDGTIWLAESGVLRLVQTTWDGDTLRIVETSHRDSSLDVSTKREMERGLASLGAELSEVSLAVPVVQGIHVHPDGHLFVQVIEQVGEQRTEIMDVFDPEGRFLGTMRLGFRMTTRGIPAFLGDTLVAVEIDDLEVPYVVRATLRRPRT